MHENWLVGHDFAFVSGGAELVTRILADEVLPGAELVYLAGDRPEALTANCGREILRLLPPMVGSGNYRLFSPMYAAFLKMREPLDGNIVASSYAFSHHIRVTGKKVVYCHTPFRQAWSGTGIYRSSGPVIERFGAHMLSRRMREADAVAAATADRYVATSRAVRDRISRAYGLSEVPIVPPPFDDRVYGGDVSGERSFFLWVGRITEPYKKLSIVVEAFTKMPHLRLVVIGDGRDRRHLERSAGSNIQFVGWKSPAEISVLYSRALAVIFPSEDDFGIVPVEAMACGTPTIAFAGGGALDTVKDGVTGFYFHEQTSAALIVAVREFSRCNWDPGAIAAASLEYTRDRFAKKMLEIIEDVNV